MRQRLWLPGLGWRQANKRLRERLERKFGIPMILIALMIMPVLIVEFFMKSQVAQYGWLRMLLHVSTGVIWFAFAGEFILMVSVAEKKVAYCKKHWIDLAIILLPLFFVPAILATPAHDADGTGIEDPTADEIGPYVSAAWNSRESTTRIDSAGVLSSIHQHEH